MKKISVIVPVYNAGAYLTGCIDALLSQSFTGFELILVDDGSTDGSGQICDRYAQTDPRICVHHTPNGGVSRARNLGLARARGEYIVFCDSDDLVRPDYLSSLLSGVMDEDTLILCAYAELRDGVEKQTPPPDERTIDLDDADTEAYAMLVERYAIWGPYCKLYQRKLIEQYAIRFDEELKSAEDLDFNMKYLEHIKKIHVVSACEYLYRVGSKPAVPKFLDESGIKSAHLISQYMISIAMRMGIYDTVKKKIARIDAEKFYYGRLPAIFAGQNIDGRSRKQMWEKLCADSQYMQICREGRACLEMSSIMRLVSSLNSYYAWKIFYAAWTLLRR